MAFSVGILERERGPCLDRMEFLPRTYVEMCHCRASGVCTPDFRIDCRFISGDLQANDIIVTLAGQAEFRADQQGSNTFSLVSLASPS